jgi:hypothetical protein
MTRTLSPENLKQSGRDFPVTALSPIEQLVMFVGADVWAARLADIAARSAASNRFGAVLKQRHALELALERMRGRGPDALSAAPASSAAPPAGAPSVAEQRLHTIVVEAVSAVERLTTEGVERLRDRLRAGLSGDGSLVDIFHLFRTAALHQARGFSLSFTGLEQGTPYDFVLSREGVEVECVCETISAEGGRDVHRLAWAQFCDRIEGQMKPWLGARPGRCLLKMTLARGLRDGRTDLLESLQSRVAAMLASGTRLDQDETAVLRVEPLTLSGASPTVESLMTRLRREFGPEAHLSVSACTDGVWAMAARSGRRNEVAAVIRAHLDRLAPGRVSGNRPAILSLFVEDIDRAEWRGLRESLELEGAARHFMTCGGAAAVVAVTCYSRMEMFGLNGPDAVADGELRFRNPAHPAAKIAALAPAILSSV